MITKVNAKEYAERISSFLEGKDFKKPFFVFGPTGIGKSAIFDQVTNAKGFSVFKSIATTASEVERLPRESGEVIEFELFSCLPPIEFFDKLIENCHMYDMPYFVEITCEDITQLEVYKKYKESIEWVQFFPLREEWMEYATKIPIVGEETF